MTYEAEEAKQAADTLLVSAQIAIELAPILRIPRYRPGHRENDAEHCFMASLVLPEIAAQHFPDLRPGLVASFCIVHELTERITGDVPTFGLSQAAINAKEADDASAAGQLISSLPPYSRDLFVRYKSQHEPEARYVRLGEKALVIAVDLLGPGKHVMAEDYDVHDKQTLLSKQQTVRERLRETFPDAELTLMHRIWDVLSDRFAAEFE